MNGHGHDFGRVRDRSRLGHKIFWDTRIFETQDFLGHFGLSLGHGNGQSHNFGHGHGHIFGHLEVDSDMDSDPGESLTSDSDSDTRCLRTSDADLDMDSDKVMTPYMDTTSDTDILRTSVSTHLCLNVGYLKPFLSIFKCALKLSLLISNCFLS